MIATYHEEYGFALSFYASSACAALSFIKTREDNDFYQENNMHKSFQRMPVLFIGHGSPMNAIQENDFTRMLNELGKTIPRPRAVLVVSAHWMTEGTWVSGMEHPRTIHDFYGFPQELFEVQYPAPGDRSVAELIQARITDFKINLDHEMWGLDHGTWSVLRHIYPAADIPVLQLSLYMERGADYHFKLGQKLRGLRDEGVLIVGSGNVVHNLRQMNWETHSPPHGWAVEFDQWIKEKLLKRDFTAITKSFLDTEAGRLSNPSLEHYYPLLYAIGASTPEDELEFHFEEVHNASISMRSFSFKDS